MEYLDAEVAESVRAENCASMTTPMWEHAYRIPWEYSHISMHNFEPSLRSATPACKIE